MRDFEHVQEFTLRRSTSCNRGRVALSCSWLSFPPLVVTVHPSHTSKIQLHHDPPFCSTTPFSVVACMFSCFVWQACWVLFPMLIGRFRGPGGNMADALMFLSRGTRPPRNGSFAVGFPLPQLVSLSCNFKSGFLRRYNPKSRRHTIHRLHTRT